MTIAELQEKWDAAASWYGAATWILEAGGLRRLRRELLAGARGRVLELAAGTGTNLSHYPPGCQVVAVDLSAKMLRRARTRHPSVRFALADAQRLPAADGSFDTVVSTLGLCTYPDPIGAVREMARVRRAGGRLLFLEHGRSDRDGIARWQDRHAPGHARHLGCHLTREPDAIVRAAAVGEMRARRTGFGMLHLIAVE